MCLPQQKTSQLTSQGTLKFPLQCPEREAKVEMAAFEIPPATQRKEWGILQVFSDTHLCSLYKLSTYLPWVAYAGTQTLEASKRG